MDKFKCLFIFIGLRMIHFPSIVIGTFAGIYIAQNYDVPDAKGLGNQFIDYLKSIEKKEK